MRGESVSGLELRDWDQRGTQGPRWLLVRGKGEVGLEGCIP